MLRSLFSAWNNGIDVLDIVFLLGSYAVLIFVMLPFHEFAHAFVATKLGDNTARWNGRLTLNPLRHLDVLGTVMLVLVGFGYAKPVPVNPFNFRKPKRDMMLTALAGPLSNILLAVVSVGLFRLLMLFTGVSIYTEGTTLYISGNDLMCNIAEYAYIIFIDVFASINVGLAAFNLLPIPPLDGSRIFGAILPDKWVYTMERYQTYISCGMLILLFSGMLDLPLALLRHGVGFLICGMFGMPNVL